MKRKIGPLPLWAWVLIAGGTIGILTYMRRRPQVPTGGDPTTGPVLDATAGAPPSSSSGGGGGGNVADPSSSTSLDDVYNQLLGLRGDISSLPGGQGLTDAPPQTKTLVDELNDVAGTIGTLRDVFGISVLTPADVDAARKTGTAAGATSQKKKDQKAINTLKERLKAAQKKKAQGSGGVGAVAHDNHGKPPRHTTQHVANGKTQKRADNSHAVNHQPAKTTHVNSGGNRQHQRTAKKKKG